MLYEFCRTHAVLYMSHAADVCHPPNVTFMHHTLTHTHVSELGLVQEASDRELAGQLQQAAPHAVRSARALLDSLPAPTGTNTPGERYEPSAASTGD